MLYTVEEKIILPQTEEGRKSFHEVEDKLILLNLVRRYEYYHERT